MPDTPTTFGPLIDLIDRAQKAVPATKYALAVVAVAAAGGLIVLILGQGKAAAVIVAAVLVAMILMFAFARLTMVKSPAINAAAVTMLWAVILLFCCFAILTATALVARWPAPFSEILGLSGRPARAETAPSERATVAEMIEKCIVEIRQPDLVPPDASASILDKISSAARLRLSKLIYSWKGGAVDKGGAPGAGVRITDVYPEGDALIVRYDWQNGRMALRPVLDSPDGRGYFIGYMLGGAFFQDNGAGCAAVIFSLPEVWDSQPEIARGAWTGVSSGELGGSFVISIGPPTNPDGN